MRLPAVAGCLVLATAARGTLSGSPSRTELILLESPLMPDPVPVRLWFPPGFSAASPGSVPLLVFLHDGYGSERSFFRRGLAAILDDAIARGDVPPIVVASPRTLGTYNSNDYLGKRRTFDFLADALVPGLLARYPQLRRDRAGRGLTGISLGGYGALKIALRGPARFGAVSALSTWVEDLSFDFQRKQGLFGRWTMGKVFGKTAQTSVIRRESLFVILEGLEAEGDTRPALLLITGDRDPWVVNGNHQRLESALVAAGVSFEARRSVGGHEWPFWRAVFCEILEFHAKHFSGT
ncbi:MAG: alpha/beta hydrolase [Thermoanaerobaculia bacterium]